jgi:lauroyl/myristoyl acyltransferase
VSGGLGPSPPEKGPRRRSFPVKFLVKDLGGLFLYYPGQALAAAAPEALLRPLSALGGDLVRRMAEDGAEMHEELRLLFGDRPLPRPAADIVRDAYREAMWNEVGVLRYPDMNPETIDRYCRVEGREHLDRALARKKGAIVLIGHFGANQMIMPALGHKGYPMSQLSAPPPVWADILRETRTTPLWERTLARRWALEQRLPVQHINVFKFLRPAFDCLSRGEVLGLAFDGGGGSSWTEARLLARTANLSTQPVQLWRKTGATLLPTVVLRSPEEARHRVVIGEPVPFPTGHRDRGAETAAAMQAIVDRFAEHVAARPDHYLQFMLMRRRVRGTDARPFFQDYPPLPGGLDPRSAERRLKEAGMKT